MRNLRGNETDDGDDHEEKEASDEEYDENADEDFNPEKAGEGDDLSSSSEDEGEQKSSRKTKATKRKSENVDLDVAGDLDSGDEATIKERKRKKRRKEAADDEDSGGEGGFIRTRAQRIVEKEERKNRKRARDGEVTIDVDQLWSELNSQPLGRASVLAPTVGADPMEIDGADDKENAPEVSADDMITIKRRYAFAGEIREVEEQVPRSSKEAQQYLAEHPGADRHSRAHTSNESGLEKPLKRPSMFEPNPQGLVKGVPPDKLRPRAPTRMDVLMAQRREEEKKKAQKMSTVQMSAVDWKEHVVKEGLKDELDEYGKSRRGFLAREAFLDRAAGAREQAARDARLKL